MSWLQIVVAGDLFLLTAPTADTVELHRRAGNHVPLLLLDPPPDLFLELFGCMHIFDRAAGVADEVVMRLALGLVYVESTSETETVYKALLNENVEIPVHVAQTEGRKVDSELIVQPVCRHMHALRLEKCEYAIALFALSQLGGHGYNIVSGAISVNAVI